MRARARGLFALIALAYACESEGFTETVVIIEAEPAILARADHTTLVVTRDPAGRPTEVHSDLRAPRPARFPYVVSLSPRDGDIAQLFSLEITAWEKGQRLSVARLLSGYVAHETRYVKLRIEDACLSLPSCAANQTCHDGRCVDAKVDPSGFTEERDNAVPSYNVPGMQGGSLSEAGVDAALPGGLGGLLGGTFSGSFAGGGDSGARDSGFPGGTLGGTAAGGFIGLGDGGFITGGTGGSPGSAGGTTGGAPSGGSASGTFAGLFGGGSTSGGISAGGSSAGGLTAGGLIAGATTGGGTPGGGSFSGGTTAGGFISGGTTGGGTPGGGSVSGGLTAGGLFAGSTTGGGTPGGGSVSGGTTAGGLFAGGTAGGGTPGGGSVSGGTTAGGFISGLDGGLGDAGLLGGSSGLPCNVVAVLKSRCNGCHTRPTGGGAPMALLTRADFLATSRTLPCFSVPIYECAELRINAANAQMPPPGSPQLTAEERATMNDWFSKGAPLVNTSCP